MERFSDEAELAVFEVAQPAVDHARRGRRGAGGEVGFVHEQSVDTIEREFTEEPRAVDPAADDCNIICHRRLMTWVTDEFNLFQSIGRDKMVGERAKCIRMHPYCLARKRA